jgi:hypothetical protein
VDDVPGALGAAITPLLGPGPPPRTAGM